MKDYIEEHRDRFLEELFAFLRIPSVSTKPENQPDIKRCAEYLKSMLLKAGVDRADIYPTKGNPVVFAEKFLDSSYKTILVYGHYDVQPPEPLELWNNPPFEPVIHDGAIWARGANDDKGQLFMHLKAFEYLMVKGVLKHNVKFIFEGEEEVGSPSLAPWVREHKDLLGADIVLVSDTMMISEKVPSINCGMRGLAYAEVKVTGPNRDLHSGHYGGAVANPINVLCDMISSLIDKEGKITIPGFYENVIELSKDDRALLAKAPFDINEYKEFLDIKEVKGEKGYSTIERTGIRPSLDVCGIWGGYTGEGAKTILPSYAKAKISMRLVPNQKAEDILKLFEDYFSKMAPDYVRVEVTPFEGGNGFLIPISSDAYQAASKAIKDVYGVEPVPSRGGGSIPILADMQEILGVNPLLMGFGLKRDGIHSPNESYLLKQLFCGMESIALFYQYY